MAAKDKSAVIRKCTCAQCGESFMMICPVSMYGWQLLITKGRVQQLQLYCSYKCMREAEEPILEKNAEKMKKAFKYAARCLQNGELPGWRGNEDERDEGC